MPIEEATVRTPDAQCRVFVLTPAAQGAWPAVIFYGDAGGIRPAMLQMGQRLADSGYLVLLPDLFYRYGAYEPLVPAEVFKGDVMAILGPLMATTGTHTAAQDTAAFLEYLDTRSDVAGAKVGAVGFCMGGGLAIASAATHSERFAAVASFHGGNLATNAPDSPHRLVSGLRAEVLIASAEADETYPASMAIRLEDALTTAGVRYEADRYTASHGWMVPDFPSYDPDSAERGWHAMLDLFGRTLRADITTAGSRS